MCVCAFASATYTYIKEKAARHTWLCVYALNVLTVSDYSFWLKNKKKETNCMHGVLKTPHSK